MTKRVFLIFSLIILLMTQTSLAATSVNIHGSHTVENISIKSGRHTFVLESQNGAPMPEGSENGIKKVTVSSGEEFDFGEITYTHPGTYGYTLKREIVPSERLSEDDARYDITVTVFSDDTSTIVLQKYGEEGKADTIAYVDKYHYFLTFNLEGGSIDGNKGPIIIPYEPNTETTLQKAPEKDGYVFDYWKGSRYEAGARYKVTEDHTFTAVYKKDSGSSGEDKGSSSRLIPGVRTGDTFEIIVLAAVFIAALCALLISYLRKKKD